MAKDSELDRLKSIQDEKFRAKQRAYEVQDSAWRARSAARDKLSNAYEEKQRAYDTQNAAWQEYQRVRTNLGSRIDSLKSQQERAFQSMKASFENASAAYNRKDGAAAKRYADEGRNYKAEAQSCTAERRGLVDQIRSAKSSFERYKPAFQSAKSKFADAKREFENAKAKHEQAKAEFNRAKIEFEKAKNNFSSRLDKVKSESKKRNSDRRAIAIKAGVPSRYVDNVWIKKDSDGNTNIYFGGIGKPDGEGHGHYVLSASGKVTYRRNPSDSHGSHNFTDKPEKKNHHRSKFPEVQYGSIDGEPVTFALGVKGREGETYLADGLKEENEFRKSTGHDHYGSGQGPNDNGTNRGKYTGPGSK